MVTIPAPINCLRPPVLKPYTPEKPKGAKAMTIAVGFLCGNGDHLILASDRQITARGAYKVKKKKYSTSTQGFVDIACFYSGEPGTFAAFTQKLEDSLNAHANLTPEIAQDEIENILHSMKLTDPYMDSCFWLLAGIIELFEKPKLIVFDGKVVFKATDAVHVMGIGDTSLINYLKEKLHRPDMTPNQGIALGAYLVKKATEYVDGCGEPIDVMHGNGMGFQLIDKNEVSSGIKAIENQEDLMFTLLVQTPFQP
jgi:20S proteasome alpha/beta subunit